MKVLDEGGVAPEERKKHVRTGVGENNYGEGQKRETNIYAVL